MTPLHHPIVLVRNGRELSAITGYAGPNAANPHPGRCSFSLPYWRLTHTDAADVFELKFPGGVSRRLLVGRLHGSTSTMTTTVSGVLAA